MAGRAVPDAAQASSTASHHTPAEEVRKWHLHKQRCLAPAGEQLLVVPLQRSALSLILTVRQQPKIYLHKSDLNKVKTLILLFRGSRRLYLAMILEVYHRMWNLSLFIEHLRNGLQRFGVGFSVFTATQQENPWGGFFLHLE